MEAAGLASEETGMSMEREAAEEIGGAGAGATVGEPFVADPMLKVRGVSVSYEGKAALTDVSIDIGHREVLAMIGASGCGKSTFLRCLNRMNDMIEGCRVGGRIVMEDADINAPGCDVVLLRARIGMVFQKPNPFPKTIFDNVAYGPRLHGLCSGERELEGLVEDCLARAGLWDEVKDSWRRQLGTDLSGGQQQRLCIARAIAVGPEAILMDEPCSALDPIATARIEALIDTLKKSYSIVLVTHSMHQAARVSSRTAYFHLGRLVEVGDTRQMFSKPRHPLTEGYLTGRFG